MIGGWLIGRHLPLQRLFLVPVAPMAVGAVASFALMRVCFTLFGGASGSGRAIDFPGSRESNGDWSGFGLTETCSWIPCNRTRPTAPETAKSTQGAHMDSHGIG